MHDTTLSRPYDDRLQEGTTVRIAVVSSPRSGNTWLRELLGSLYRIATLAYHTPTEIPWESLPDECVIQIHWRRDEGFARALPEAGFKVVVLARHPLDLLVSILHFAQDDRETKHWLSGEGGHEAALVGTDPSREEFFRYATGPRARALLSISLEWWAHGECAVRYEELVHNTERTLGHVARSLGVEPRASAAEAVQKNDIDRLRSQFAEDYHFWQGKPGLWRQLIPAPLAHTIASAHADSFSRLGYLCDPAPTLTPAQAEVNWLRLELDSSTRSARRNRERFVAAVAAEREARQRIANLEHTLAASEHAAEQRIANLENTLAASEHARAELRAELVKFAGLGAGHIGLARWIERSTRPFRRS